MKTQVKFQLKNEKPPCYCKNRRKQVFEWHIETYCNCTTNQWTQNIMSNKTMNKTMRGNSDIFSYFIKGSFNDVWLVLQTTPGFLKSLNKLSSWSLLMKSLNGVLNLIFLNRAFQRLSCGLSCWQKTQDSNSNTLALIESILIKWIFHKN